MVVVKRVTGSCEQQLSGAIKLLLRWYTVVVGWLFVEAGHGEKGCASGGARLFEVGLRVVVYGECVVRLLFLDGRYGCRPENLVVVMVVF